MENIKKIIESHIPSKAELLLFRFDSRSSFIKVVIDSSEDISVHDTAMLARDIKNDDYILSNFPDGLKLEVGTPGIGSELKRTFQYQKNVGRIIDIEHYNGTEFIKKTYILKSVGKNGIIVEKDKKDNDILFNDIKSAKIKISFDNN